MLVVGLTGNIASGKSTVAQLLVERGARLIDSDVLARRAVEPGSPALRAIVARWGDHLRTPDGALDRAALRRIVFRDRSELEALNAIVHPEVERLRLELIEDARAAGAEVVVCDIPLLFERQLEREVDCVVLVDAPDDVRHDRLVSIRRIAPDEADAMMAAQQPASQKRPHADFVIDNVGTLEDLRRRVADVWEALRHRAHARLD